ncbi:hypothetical protein [Winogradskyella ursingii]|uniref:hypothetical protein n=1 Tax=Winogradskyella ursingii TaxID=2686079 RepID=UPI0015C8C9CF|nr:hypothetical protein [Winogradskyella ursingii]
MCQFNFLVTKEKSSISEIKEIASEFGLNYAEYKLNTPNSNEIQTFLTTTKNCDCGSVLGKIYSDDYSEPDWKKEQKKLERKRFSKRRIELLLEQKRKEFTEKNSSELIAENKETEKWIEFLTDKRLKNKLNEIGILYHQFSGELQNERIKIEKGKTNSVENINIDFLKNIKDNELNWIKL